MQKLKREELEQMTLTTLRDRVAKDLKITGRWSMKKSELIAAILSEREESQEESQKEERVVDSNHKVKPNLEDKQKYVESAKSGTLVAFRTREGLVKSAKIVAKNLKAKKLRLETKHGSKHEINYEDVIWVRTGERWPKGVFELFGKNPTKGEDDVNEKRKV